MSIEYFNLADQFIDEKDYCIESWNTESNMKDLKIIESSEGVVTLHIRAFLIFDKVGGDYYFEVTLNEDDLFTALNSGLQFLVKTFIAQEYEAWSTMEGN
jgi:hypothetical protein